MELHVTVDMKSLDRKTRALVADIKTFPKGKSVNPLLLALVDYRTRLAATTRPTVAQTGRWFGNTWKHLAPQYTRKDGTTVWVWGGTPRADGKGTVKGRLTSTGTRYKRSDKQLGNREGGLFSDWLASDPILTNTGKTATITSNKAYAARQASMRNWFGGKELKKFLQVAMAERLRQYLRAMIVKQGLQ